MSEFDEQASRERWTKLANEPGFAHPKHRDEWIEFAVSRDYGMHVYNEIEGPAFARYEAERKRARKQAAKVEGPMRKWLERVTEAKSTEEER